MTDAFEGLRSPTAPVDPDPIFAAGLRARLERALLDPREDTMTTTTRPRATAEVRLHALTPYIAVSDARVAVEFYMTAFGATRRDEPIVMPDGRVGHVEVALGDSVLMLADEFPEMGLAAPVTRGGVSQSLRLEVADPDAVVGRAVAAGATLERPVTDSPYGRGGVVLDPSGHRWMVSREPAAARPGDVIYTSLWTPDTERAVRFYSAVLGWATAPSHQGRGRQVTGLAGHVGIWGGVPDPTGFLCFSVPDATAAAAMVSAAGGTADEPVAGPDGPTVDCTDDQGLRFALAEGGVAAPTEPGGLAYAELRVPDAGRARAFYGTVLGLRFLPGRDPGYWHPEADGRHTRPMTGLAGGHGTATVVPGFAVTGLDAATAAVRAAGGRTRGAEDGGVECIDDQGAVFTLRPV